MSLLLAIESSCDEMAMAVLKDQREFLSSVVASQIDIHAMYGGVVPEIASRKHVECVSVVLKETLKQANIKTDRLSEKSKTTLSQYDRLRMIQSQSERKVV